MLQPLSRKYFSVKVQICGTTTLDTEAGVVVLGEVCSFAELIARVADFSSGMKVATVLLSMVVVTEKQ